jgi:hypothetical protein
MRKEIEVESGTAEKVMLKSLRGLKAVSDQTGKHNSIKKLARFSDLAEDKLEGAVEKLSPNEKRRMLKAFSELNRVVTLIVNTQPEEVIEAAVV